MTAPGQTDATVANTEVGKGGLQSQIAKLLDSLGICYIRSRTDKRATTQRGTPDFILSVWGKSHEDPAFVRTQVYACSWEIKCPRPNKRKPVTVRLRTDQEKMRARMTTRPNAWRYAVITSRDEAIAELKAIGVIS